MASHLYRHEFKVDRAYRVHLSKWDKSAGIWCAVRSLTAFLDVLLHELLDILLCRRNVFQRPAEPVRGRIALLVPVRRTR
jgi:hypothetical protein